MNQKWGKEGICAVRISKRLDFAGAKFAFKAFIILKLCTGFFLAETQFASSQTYAQVVMSAGAKSVVRVEENSPPLNDNFSNSTLLSGFVAIGSGSTSGATAEAGEPAHDGPPCYHIRLVAMGRTRKWFGSDHEQIKLR